MNQAVLGVLVITTIFSIGYVYGLQCWDCMNKRADAGNSIENNVGKPVKDFFGRRKRGTVSEGATNTANTVGGLFSGAVMESCAREPFTGKNVSERECAVGQNACYKEYVKGNEVKVTRMCVVWAGEKKCTTKDEVTRCYCDGDKCNAAVSLSSFASLLILLSFTAIIF